MKYERKKLLAKLAYLYYIEEKSQSEIATETGIYRTTVSRMLTEAKKEGIVKIEIENFDSKLFRLENYVKEKYNLHELEIVPKENKELAEGILTSKYFDDLRDSWENLDIAVVGIGGPADTHNPQWFDMLTEKDFTELRSEAAVGEVCCRFFDQEGKPVYQDLQERTVAIRLEELKQIPKTVSLAYGERKAGAILSVIKAGYINHLVTDEATIIKMLELDGDANFLE